MTAAGDSVGLRPSPGRQRSIYRAANGMEIILDVPEPPMGARSGFIPPPVIEFFKDGAQIPFVYAGDAR